MIRRVLALPIVVLFALSAVAVRGQSPDPEKTAATKADLQKLRDEFTKILDERLPKPMAAVAMRPVMPQLPPGTVPDTTSDPSKIPEPKLAPDSKLPGGTPAQDRDCCARLKLDQRVSALEASNLTLSAGVAKLEKEINNDPDGGGLRDTVYQLKGGMMQIAKAAGNGPDGKPVYVVDLQRTMKNDPDAEVRLADAVAQDMHRGLGILRVHNETSTEQRIQINGRGPWYPVPARRTQPFEVRSGNVTTEIPQEAAKTWFIPTNQTQNIVIKLAEPRYVDRFDDSTDLRPIPTH